MREPLETRWTVKLVADAKPMTWLQASTVTAMDIAEQVERNLMTKVEWLEPVPPAKEKRYGIAR